MIHPAITMAVLLLSRLLVVGGLAALVAAYLRRR